MKRFKNILFFADEKTGRCAAMERAVTLASTNNARLTVFDVVPESNSSPDIEALLGLNIEEELRKTREAALNELIAEHGTPETAIQKRVVSGIPFVEVIRAVLTGQYDLVIKEARPPNSFVKRMLGSTDLHLLRKCPCPIWIDRPDAVVPYRTVLAAVDPSDDENGDSARLIMDLATSLAGREGASVAVVHTWRLPGESLLQSDRARFAGAELDELLDRTRRQHGDKLDALLTEYGFATTDERVHLLKGDPASRVPLLSKELDVDLVVLGTLGRRRMPGYFIGSTAEDILQTTQASVLAIKPVGFISPITTGE